MSAQCELDMTYIMVTVFVGVMGIVAQKHFPRIYARKRRTEGKAQG